MKIGLKIISIPVSYNVNAYNGIKGTTYDPDQIIR